MSPRGAGPRLARPWRRPHHRQRKLLMRNAQDIHGRGHHSKQPALNYIFSDCKLLLTASLPSLQLTFLTKGHLLTSARRFPGRVEPRAGRDGTAEGSAAGGPGQASERGAGLPRGPGRLLKTDVSPPGNWRQAPASSSAAPQRTGRDPPVPKP